MLIWMNLFHDCCWYLHCNPSTIGHCIWIFKDTTMSLSTTCHVSCYPDRCSFFLSLKGATAWASSCCVFVQKEPMRMQLGNARGAGKVEYRSTTVYLYIYTKLLEWMIIIFQQSNQTFPFTQLPEFIFSPSIWKSPGLK